MNSDKTADSIDIFRIWNSGTEEIWNCALSEYYTHLSDKQKNLEDELSSITFSTVRGMSGEDFYSFLYEKYYPWKFTDRRILSRRLSDLKMYTNKQGREELLRVKEKMFRLYDFCPDDTELLLCVVTKIRGLGVAAGSGLLSILFPQFYGTPDQFLVRSLLRIENLPEYQDISAIRYPENLKPMEGVLLEDILRRKANELNKRFGSSEQWTPRKIDMVLWAHREQDKHK